MSGAPLRVVFAAGGSGGHIYPALAVLEALRTREPSTQAHFLCSQRPVDERVLGPTGEAYTPSPAQPFGLRPKTLLRFVGRWGAALRQARSVLREADALVVTGGFVSPPAARAAKAEGVPVVVVNLDAVPGKASRLVARWADMALTSAPPASCPPDWEAIPPIVRNGAVSQASPEECRALFGLDADKPTILVTGGSQGAQSLNAAVVAAYVANKPHLEGWQFLHQAGGAAGEAERIQGDYRKYQASARVLPFIDDMGAAWRAATLAIGRGGASTVAEAWASATPTVFVPYPGHSDDHQAANARPLLESGCGFLAREQSDALSTADEINKQLVPLVSDEPAREACAEAFARLGPTDGAQRVAHRVFEVINRYH